MLFYREISSGKFPSAYGGFHPENFPRRLGAYVLQLITFLKLLFILLWFCLSSMAAFFIALLRWGDLDLDHDLARLVSVPCLRIAGIQLELEGEAHLDEHRPCIFVMNHQSNLDALILGCFFPRQTVVIGKKEILWIPFFGLAYKASGNILIDRKKRAKAIAGLSRAVQFIQKRKASIIIFPEGTRNRSDQPLQSFKKGAFHMAIEAQVPIVPIVISPVRKVFDWNRKALNPGVLRVQVLPPVPSEGFSANQVDELSSRVRSVMLEAVRGLSASA